MCMVSCLKQDLYKLRYIHTVYMPLKSMANGFQSEVRFAYVADILFVHFKSMFLTCGMSVRHYISKQCMYALFSNKKKEENLRLVRISCDKASYIPY